MSAIKESRKVTWSQTLCACVDGAGAFAMATVLGYTSAGLLLMRKDENFKLSEEQGSWIGAAVPGTGLIGSLLAGHLMEALGRKNVCVMTSVPAMFAWICIVCSSSAFQVIAARLISGFCLGVYQVSTKVFVSETVHPKLRPMFNVIPAVSVMLGFLSMNIAGAMTDWRGMAWIGAGSCLPLFVLLSYLPETPYFLLKSGKTEEALDTLKWLKSTEKEAQMEFKDIQQSLSSTNNENSTNFSDMTKPPYRWPFYIAILLHAFQQTTGISAITTFMGLIFERAGSSVDASITSSILTVISIVTIVVMGRLLPKYPRKAFIKWSSQLIIISMMVLSAYLWARESEGVPKEMSKSLTYIPFLSILIYTLGFCVGWGPLPWIFIGDSLPLKIRGTGAGIVVATNWAFNFFITKTYNWGTIILGSYAIFFIYAVLTFFGMITMMYNIPETFGFSDTQLEKYYKDAYKEKSN